jgi:hypothetical protein
LEASQATLENCVDTSERSRSTFRVGDGPDRGSIDRHLADWNFPPGRAIRHPETEAQAATASLWHGQGRTAASKRSGRAALAHAEGPQVTIRVTASNQKAPSGAGQLYGSSRHEFARLHEPNCGKNGCAHQIDNKQVAIAVFWGVQTPAFSRKRPEKTVDPKGNWVYIQICHP